MNNRLGALLFALLAICLFFTFQVPDYGFVGSRNLSLLMVDFAITATLAVADPKTRNVLFEKSG